jgi:TPP-dependent pyruvate/acetoin dehydrogenase alpha subunit
MRSDSASLVDLPRDDLLRFHRKMWEIRAFEEKAIELFTAGELPGFLHSQIGQEAVCVGACSALRGDDWITSTHRGHGDIIAKGGRLDRMMAELFGKETGYCRGKGGSMHIFDFGIGVLGANGIVGAGLPIAVGAGLSAHLRGTDQVSLSFFGDGASNEGAFHEALNLASTWQLPVVFVCQNNEYAESTPRMSQQTIPDIASRSAGYALPGSVVDGMDVLAVHAAVSAAVQRAREGGGATLLEAKTYRFYGHSVGDPGVYRSSQEVASWKERDPIRSFEATLEGMAVLTVGDAARVEEEVRLEVERAVEFARVSPEPPRSAAFEDVYA